MLIYNYLKIKPRVYKAINEIKLGLGFRVRVRLFSILPALSVRFPFEINWVKIIPLIFGWRNFYVNLSIFALS